MTSGKVFHLMCPTQKETAQQQQQRERWREEERGREKEGTQLVLLLLLCYATHETKAQANF